MTTVYLMDTENPAVRTNSPKLWTTTSPPNKHITSKQNIQNRISNLTVGCCSFGTSTDESIRDHRRTCPLYYRLLITPAKHSRNFLVDPDLETNPILIMQPASSVAANSDIPVYARFHAVKSRYCHKTSHFANVCQQAAKDSI